ncbi:hypothetical protein RUMHYD_00279 [Blautia hydrogenotrophica DSM 10507]|uniref:Uncharacterized protein n=1 Tax=Blautia hydrogenotrophica (strain DSM 10507 / JCM 14656 / S5a33) TaxID=476272 RepID=C0CHG5_BLAHS|nr:hypothetical protein RUMHYD_00279 [Blautia hydrogenotrophica DSM 10507]
MIDERQEETICLNIQNEQKQNLKHEKPKINEKLLCILDKK